MPWRFRRDEEMKLRLAPESTRSVASMPLSMTFRVSSCWWRSGEDKERMSEGNSGQSKNLSSGGGGKSRVEHSKKCSLGEGGCRGMGLRRIA